MTPTMSADPPSMRTTTSLLLLLPLLLSLWAETGEALLLRAPSVSNGRHASLLRRSQHTPRRVFDFNPFDDAEALASRLQKLDSQEPPCAAPLFEKLCSPAGEEQAFVLQEKALSLVREGDDA